MKRAVAVGGKARVRLEASPSADGGSPYLVPRCSSPVLASDASESQQVTSNAAGLSSVPSGRKDRTPASTADGASR